MSSRETNIDQIILEEIIDISCKISGLKKCEISINSSINNDLKIDGDDIVELIQALIFKYNLSTNNFEYSRYFDWESDANILAQIKNIFKPKVDKKYDVKIHDLYRWVINKEWSELK